MKVVALIVRLFLGLVFAVFGSNAFLHFMPMPQLTGYPAQFLGALNDTGYLQAIAAFQVAGGVILILGRYVPVGLTLLGPIVVNILLYHIFIDRSGLPVAIVVAILETFLIWFHWFAFAGIFRAGVEPESA